MVHQENALLDRLASLQEDIAVCSLLPFTWQRELTSVGLAATHKSYDGGAAQWPKTAGPGGVDTKVDTALERRHHLESTQAGSLRLIYLMMRVSGVHGGIEHDPGQRDVNFYIGITSSGDGGAEVGVHREADLVRVVEVVDQPVAMENQVTRVERHG